MKNAENKGFCAGLRHFQNVQKKLTFFRGSATFGTHTVTKKFNWNMRTKTLLLTVAALAAGLTAYADATVYSANVVGYINQVIPSGFSMVANQLDTGTNTVVNLLPAPPNNTIVYKFSGTLYSGNGYYYGWSDTNMTLNPGEGAFIYNPGAPITNAFIGTVLQGTFTNSVTGGFSMQSYYVPKAGLISSDMGYPVANNDIVYLWDNTNQKFVGYGYYYGWPEDSGEPMLNVGQAFFIYRAGADTNWVTAFSITNN